MVPAAKQQSARNTMNIYTTKKTQDNRDKYKGLARHLPQIGFDCNTEVPYSTNNYQRFIFSLKRPEARYMLVFSLHVQSLPVAEATVDQNKSVTNDANKPDAGTSP